MEPLYSKCLGTKKCPDYRGVFSSGVNLHRESELETSCWDVLNTEVSSFQVFNRGGSTVSADRGAGQCGVLTKSNWPK